MQPNIIAPPQLNDGEIYVGAIISAGALKNHHIILLPGEVEVTDWNDAMEWAASISGELPDLLEFALLFAAAKHEFTSKLYYWMREQHQTHLNCVWCQDPDGGLEISSEDCECSARAIRRLEIEKD